MSPLPITGICTACFTARMIAPIRRACIALHARARMNGDRFDPDLFRHARHIHGDDIVFVPAGANFDGQRNLYGRANWREKLFKVRQIAQQGPSRRISPLFSPGSRD